MKPKMEKASTGQSGMTRREIIGMAYGFFVDVVVSGLSASRSLGRCR